MGHAPGCNPEVYVQHPAPEGFEWRRKDEVRIGDLDQFDRPVTDIVWSKNGNSLRVRSEGMLPVERIGRSQPSDRGLYRVRAEAAPAVAPEGPKLALVSDLTVGQWVTEADTPEGPWYQLAKVNRASIRLWLDDEDHSAGTVALSVRPTDTLLVKA